ncbi:MAG TPA: molybdenum cofactor biosynthesis protein MoaE [Chloroflexota bacterium]|nr:molybdenum cofactor biosynthesis protein MoaE [Chloroflexota bacterium]
MKVTVKLFAGHRERTGTDRVAVDLPEGSSVADLFAQLTVRYPVLAETESFTTFARNRNVVDQTEILTNGDEVALLQPVSGGSEPATVTIRSEPLSAGDCIAAVEAPGCGGIAVFLGTVRDNSDGKSTDHLEYDAYVEMAEEVIQTIVAEADSRWEIGRTAVQHRTGDLAIGEVSVIVAVAAAHRAGALDACRYIIDELKARAPIWKKEFGEGGEVWVGGPQHSK